MDLWANLLVNFPKNQGSDFDSIRSLFLTPSPFPTAVSVRGDVQFSSGWLQSSGHLGSGMGGACGEGEAAAGLPGASHGPYRQQGEGGGATENTLEPYPLMDLAWITHPKILLHTHSHRRNTQTFLHRLMKHNTPPHTQDHSNAVHSQHSECHGYDLLGVHARECCIIWKR